MLLKFHRHEQWHNVKIIISKELRFKILKLKKNMYT